MARVRNIVQLRLSLPSKRPKIGHLGGFKVDIDGGDQGEIQAKEVDEDSVIIAPVAYYDEEEDSLHASSWQEYAAKRCWKTSAVYEQIHEDHLHVIQ